MPDRLDEVLRHAQDLGLFGPGPVEEQRAHSESFCRLATEGLPTALRFLDLGSGGGLPGLALALARPQARGTLLDARVRRGRFLVDAVEELGLADRVDVVAARAEDAARDPAHRERYDLVVARAFAPPAVTAECAVAFLRPGGRLAVSEPPDEAPARWDEPGLAALGLESPSVVQGGEATAALFRRSDVPLDARWPRRPGIVQKRPLW